MLVLKACKHNLPKLLEHMLKYTDESSWIDNALYSAGMRGHIDIALLLLQTDSLCRSSVFPLALCVHTHEELCDIVKEIYK